MRKREREILCNLIARYEWNTASGTSESAALGSVARDLRHEFKITHEDVYFHLAWQIKMVFEGKTGTDLSEEDFDQLVDYVYSDYENFVDSFEAVGWEKLMEIVLNYWDKQS
ncbi:hypothetical protein PP935_gp243 [Rhizobium phage RHph_N34]|uniref:Uncharacterized protein n=1 Tax=Rhizobium phage RHph_N34 TaxID=2509586 RepID=A0A7S5V031_9CAUD|nr:hypothetical protein PP935_gp243 [Rhizobium phage RHph_N34]QIG74018.1 hypothetical protein EVC06_243 [Rhizobium phage RHph_N34]